MKTKVTSNWVHYVVEFEDGSRFDVHVNPSNPEDVMVDGVSRDVKLEADRHGLRVSAEGGPRQPLALRYEHGELVAETADGQRLRAKVSLARADEFRQHVLAQPPPAAVVRSGKLEAPIAGNVLSFLVLEGAAVDEGEGVLVLEAMKMQNTIPARVAGVVRFEVQPGQVVRSGDLLATITAVGSN